MSVYKRRILSNVERDGMGEKNQNVLLLVVTVSAVVIVGFLFIYIGCNLGKDRIIKEDVVVEKVEPKPQPPKPYRLLTLPQDSDGMVSGVTITNTTNFNRLSYPDKERVLCLMTGRILAMEKYGNVIDFAGYDTHEGVYLNSEQVAYVLVFKDKQFVSRVTRARTARELDMLANCFPIRVEEIVISL